MALSWVLADPTASVSCQFSAVVEDMLLCLPVCNSSCSQSQYAIAFQIAFQIVALLASVQQ
jgi:hypothetical protein